MKNPIHLLAFWLILSTSLLQAQTRSTLFYPMNQSPVSGANLIEDAMLQTTGTIQNTTLGLPASIGGAASYSTNAWDFSSTDAYIEVSSNTVTDSLGDISKTNGITIGMWINHNYINEPFRRISGKEGTFDVLISQSSGIGIVDFRFAGETYSLKNLTSDNVLDGNWHHIAATLDFTTSTDNFKVYIDGSLSTMKSENISSSFYATNESIKIGARHSGGNPFPGKIDEYIIFNQALTAAEITQLYDDGGYSFSNLPPMVNAGADTNVLPSVSSIDLAATISDDGLPDPPAALTITWSEVTPTGNVTFTAPNNANTTANFSTEGTFLLQITVSDGDYTVTDEIEINVANAPPIVEAGDKQILILPDTEAALEGTASDPDNSPSPLTHTWSKVSGVGTVTFGDANSLVTTATFSQEGTYVLRLTANDGDETTTDDLEVLVNPALKQGGYNYAWDQYDVNEFAPQNITFDFADARNIKHAPPIGEHPRLYFSTAELPEVKNRMNNTTSGQRVMEQIHAYTTLLHKGYSNGGTYNHNADYGLDVNGNQHIDNAGKWDSHAIYYDLIGGEATALDGVDNKRRYLLASVMALEAYECLIRAGETDTDTGLSYDDRATDLATAMAHWASLVIGDSDLNWANYQFFGGEHMAFCYDLNFNVMTTAQQDLVREALAATIPEHPRYGSETEPYATTSNWVGLNTFELLTNLAIEGEEGYDANLTVEYMRSYYAFLTYGWYESGTPYEGLGKNYQFVGSLVAAAKRGYSLLGHPNVKAYGQYFLPAIMQPYGYAFEGKDVWGGSGWDTKVGGYKFNANDIIGLKWVFPDDEKIDFVWRNYIGGTYTNNSTDYVYQQVYPATSGYHNYLLLAAILAEDWGTGDWATQNEQTLEEKSFLAPERGLAILRSGFAQNDLSLQFHCRQDLGGHTHGDRNSFSLSGLGRIWVRYTYGSAFQETEYHSCLLVDDLGVKITDLEGRKARQPGRILQFEDEGVLAKVAGDATYAYSWEWHWQSRSPLQDHSWLGTDSWEKVMETWNDFRFQQGNEFYHNLAFYDYANWNAAGNLERIIKRPFNPMERVYRTAAMIRAAKPYVIIADDVQKDDVEHNYKWLAQVANDLSVTATDVQLTLEDYRNDVILSESEGNRKLLVRVLNNNGHCADGLTLEGEAAGGSYDVNGYYSINAVVQEDTTVNVIAGRSIELQSGFAADLGSIFSAKIEMCEEPPAYLETITPGINGNSPITRLIVEADVVAPDFKILMFPFEDGDALPVTNWNVTKDTLTVSIGGETEVIEFKPIDGRTHINLITPISTAIEEVTTTDEMITEQFAATTSIEKSSNELSELKVYPLPFGEEFALQFVSPVVQEIELMIFNVLGEKVHEQSINAQMDKNELVIASADWASGSYFLQLKSANKVLEVKRLLKW